ncbi:hypothetical protein GHT06_013368 [Daphnia sinensis]|uniref:Uncharacterized protein n=1 Tax=Daphnia sinensis TaxID=1820382 RepID=A0AAD5KX68_9CRUS|nr:hypothetical protein GHT06_013368 [Daphnia sinensis]
MLVIVPREAYGTMLRYRRAKSDGVGGQIRAVSDEFVRLLKIGRAVSGHFGQFPTDINKSIFSDGGLRPFWATFDKS